MNTRTQVEMISLRPEFMYTLYSMTHPYIHLLLAVAKYYTTPARNSWNYHLYFVLKNPREDSPADGSTYQFVLESLLYVSIRIPFRPRCFFVVASLNVLNHKALSYKFFEFVTTLPFYLNTCILHCQMSTNSPKS